MFHNLPVMISVSTLMSVDCIWNVMAHVQKPDFVFRRNGRVHLNRRGRQSTACSRGVRISGSNAGYAMFRGSVKSTGYALHLPVSPSLPLPCVTVCHHISTGLYHLQWPCKPSLIYIYIHRLGCYSTVPLRVTLCISLHLFLCTYIHTIISALTVYHSAVNKRKMPSI